jgi:hypothetical protein
MTTPNGCTLLSLKVIGKQQQNVFCHLAKSNVEDVGQNREATIRAPRGQPKASANQWQNPMDAQCSV